MRQFAGEDLLRAWECSRELPEHEAVLAVLALASPERSLDGLAMLPLCERNALLLELRAAALGRRMNGFAVCPDCGAQLEFALDPVELAKGLQEERPVSSQQAPGAKEDSDAVGGYRMRPVNSTDLLASSKAMNEEQARSILLARTLGVDRPELMSLDMTPDQLLERFERINARAEIGVQLDCTACRKALRLDLDIAHFLLREIAAAARRLMTEIHELASAYGWSEQSIAAMSGTRRTAYLEMLDA